MTKKHHPHNRAERLALKQELDEKIKVDRANKVWRKLTKESLKQWETERELEQVAHNPNLTADN